MAMLIFPDALTVLADPLAVLVVLEFELITLSSLAAIGCSCFIING